VLLRASRGRQGLSRPTADGSKKSLEPSAVLRNASAPVRSPCQGLLEARRERLRASRTTADGSEKSLEPSAVPPYAADAPRDAARRTADGVEKSLQASAVDRELLGRVRGPPSRDRRARVGARGSEIAPSICSWESLRLEIARRRAETPEQRARVPPPPGPTSTAAFRTRPCSRRWYSKAPRRLRAELPNPSSRLYLQ